MKRGSLDEKLKYVNFIVKLGQNPIDREHTFSANIMYDGENLLPFSQQGGEFLDPITNTLKKASNYLLASDMVVDAIIFIRLPDRFITNLTMGDFLDKLKIVDTHMVYYINIEVKFENDVVGPTYVETNTTTLRYLRGVIRNRINNSFLLEGVRFLYSGGMFPKDFNFFKNYFETKTLVEPSDLIEFDINVNLDALKAGYYKRKTPPCGIYTGTGHIKPLTNDGEMFFDASVERDGECIILSDDTQTLCPVADDIRWKTNPSGKQYADITCMYYVPDITYLQEKIRLYKELPEPNDYYNYNVYAKETIEKLIEEYCTKRGKRDDVSGLQGETCYELFPDTDYYTINDGGCVTEYGKYIKYEELETDELKNSCYPGGKPGDSCYDVNTGLIPSTITTECYPECYSNGDKKAFKETELGKLCYPFYIYNDIDCVPNEDDKVSGGLKYKYDHDKNCKVYTCINGYINANGKCKKDKTNIKLLVIGSFITLIIILILII